MPSHPMFPKDIPRKSDQGGDGDTSHQEHWPSAPCAVLAMTEELLLPPIDCKFKNKATCRCPASHHQTSGHHPPPPCLNGGVHGSVSFRGKFQ